MNLNPHSNDGSGGKDWQRDEVIGIEEANVTDTSPEVGNKNTSHSVTVVPVHRNEPVTAEVTVTQHGGYCVPTEGARVVLGYRINGRPLVLGSRYISEDDVPDLEPGERLVSHPTTDSYVRFANDGSVTMEGDGGNTVELTSDGSVVVNGGSTRPVTDVDFSNNNVTRAKDTYVQSE